MLTMPQRATVKGWSDGVVKTITGVGGALAIIIVLNNVFGWSIGGLVTGNQTAQTEQKRDTNELALAMKNANDAMDKKVTSVDEKATRIEASMAKISEQLGQISVMTQRLNDHDRHLQQLDVAIGLVNDRITNVSQNANDRMNQIASDAARLQGRLEGTPTTPDIRQPRRQ